MNIKQAIESTKGLTSNERALLARCLISSLDSGQEEGVDEAWAELVETRYSEILSAELEPVSWGDIKKDIKD